MRALTLTPHTAGSARLEEVAEPDPSEGDVLVEAVSVGVDGTDQEIVEGGYGWAPPGRDRLVLGHESLGLVLDAPAGGDLLVTWSWPSSGTRIRSHARAARPASGTCVGTAKTPSTASTSATDSSGSAIESMHIG